VSRSVFLPDIVGIVGGYQRDIKFATHFNEVPVDFFHFRYGVTHNFKVIVFKSLLVPEGSATEKVVNKSERPVLVLKSGSE